MEASDYVPRESLRKLIGAVDTEGVKLNKEAIVAAMTEPEYATMCVAVLCFLQTLLGSDSRELLIPKGHVAHRGLFTNSSTLDAAYFRLKRFPPRPLPHACYAWCATLLHNTLL